MTKQEIKDRLETLLHMINSNNFDKSFFIPELIYLFIEYIKLDTINEDELLTK